MPVELVIQPEHNLVQTGIRIGNTGIGHVLEAGVNQDVLIKAVTQADETGKLKVAAKIRLAKFMGAEQGRAYAGIDGEAFAWIEKRDARSNGQDRSGRATAMQDPERGIEPGVESPAGVIFMIPGQSINAGDLILIEILPLDLIGETNPCTHFQPTWVRAVRS